MRVFVIALLILASSIGYSQKLDKLGKIDLDEIPSLPDHRIEKINGEYKVLKDSFVFDGNTYYNTPNGFITGLIIVDNEKDYIKHYNKEGVLQATILSDKIINLKVSPQGKRLAFYNSGNIISIDLSNHYHMDTLAGSLVYSFVGNDNLIYYNSDGKYIAYQGNRILINEYPNQFLDFNGKVIVITKKYIYELIGNSLILKHKFRGMFFDAKIINDEFYFVDKVEKRKSESFSLYKASDFSKILLIDRIDDLNR